MQKNIGINIHAYLSKILLLAALYILTAKLGLYLAMPPGYVTIIWPPSGIALGMLLIYGWRFWPGVMLGSLLINCYVAGAYTPELGLVGAKLIIAFCIATGSTLQALAAYGMIQRFIGLPLKLSTIKELILILFFSAPIACLIAASIGISTLYYSGIIPAERILQSWLTWWLGDVLGIILFLPIVLMTPRKLNPIFWRGTMLSNLPRLVFLTIMIPLALTLYGWKISYEHAYSIAHSEFEFMTVESEMALSKRLDFYANALRGAKGLFLSSTNISREDWRNYVEAINISSNYPGMNGIGLIYDVAAKEMPAFLNKRQEFKTEQFVIHPKTSGLPFYIITYIEPLQNNLAAVGLNIAFEENRRDAAERARTTGKPALSRNITLVQDEQKTPGFLLLDPIYNQSMPLNTANEKKAAFLGWVYAPLLARNILSNLTQSQGQKFNLSVYEIEKTGAKRLIYSSGEIRKDASYSKSKLIKVMQQNWLLVWDSTLAFEEAGESNIALFILLGGLLFTGLFGILVLVISIQRKETIEWMTSDKRFLVPTAVFIAVASASFMLYRTLEHREMEHIKALVTQEANKLNILINAELREKLEALVQLEKRWESAGGTPFTLWKEDVRNYLNNFSGLKTIEWVDSSYHVRWVEPIKGNEKVLGMNILFDKKRETILKGAAEKSTPILSPPLNLIQGYQAVLAYVPLKTQGAFDGFIVGIFSIEDLFEGSTRGQIDDRYSIKISYDGKTYFEKNKQIALRNMRLAMEADLKIYDKTWQMQIMPTTTLLQSQKTSLPFIILNSGILIALLSAFAVRLIFVLRLKSVYLEKAFADLQVKKLELQAHQSALESLVEQRTQEYLIARDEALLANKEKSEFFSNISHELRTPMHAIMSFAKLGIKNLEKNQPEKLTQYLNNIYASGQRLTALINNLLDISKIEAMELSYTFLLDELKKVIEYSLVELQSLTQTKNINIAVHYHTKDSIAVFDKMRLIQVLINLVSNAIKFSEKDSTVTISVSDAVLNHLRQEENQIECIRVSVENDGPCIPENELEKIFEKFVQSTATKTGAGGTGLGLSISKKIIDAHGGLIWAENRSDRSGVVFHFQIPRNNTGLEKS